MKLIYAFFRLIRWPNLVFIALTQFLFWYFVIPFSQKESGNSISVLSTDLFLLLMLASICIAAAGYIINDYFDVNIDQINKSEKVILGSLIKRRYAIVAHAILSLTGLLLSFYIGQRLMNYFLPFFNFLAIIFLILYSTTLKKKLLVGNIIISLLTAWVIMVLAISEYRFSALEQPLFWNRLFQLSLIYAGFAFIISLIREVIKDMEDIKGDQKFQCTTMPIVWGIPVSKMFVAVWLTVLTAFVFVFSIYLLFVKEIFLGIYGILLVALPCIWILKKLYHSQTTKDFHHLSMLVKLLMLMGILSMIFI